MITLRDLFEVSWTITELDIYARGDDLGLKHRFLFTPEDPERMPKTTRYDTISGRATYIWAKINEHGKPKRSGPETGWGVDTKQIPSEILDAEIRHLQSTGQWTNTTYREGKRIICDVIMHDLQIEAALDKLKAKGKPDEDYSDSNIINLIDW